MLINPWQPGSLPEAAIVVNVRDNGNLDVNVFHNDHNRPVTYDGNLEEGTAPGTWMWPPRS